MNCPRCQVEMKALRYESAEILGCGVCRGVWLDRDALWKVIAGREKRFELDQIWQILGKSGRTHVTGKERRREAFCPKCELTLVAGIFSHHSGIVVDRCPEEHGVFLDHGELEGIQIFQEYVREYLL